MTRKTALAIVALIYLCNFSIAYGKDVVIHSSNGNNGLELVNLDPPQVTYDEELNELYVYFGSTGSIDLDCDDGTGTPYYIIYGEYHSGYTSATYYYLPAGYYTVTIHSIYGVTYYGNFTVSY